MRAKIGCLLVAAVSLVCASPPTASAQTSVKFAIDWVFQGLHAPFAVAAQKKYFEREGLAVKVDRGSGSSDTIAKVASGTYDIGYGNTNLLVKFNHDNRTPPSPRYSCSTTLRRWRWWL
jgi:NitT/TauT family transport system substrate-binding protein